MKTTAEYAQDPSVVGLVGKAKREAIGALYKADKEAEAKLPKAKKAKLPTDRELAQKARDYANAFHTLKVFKETEKAVAVEVVIDFCDLEIDRTQTVFFPKSLLKEGQAPGWLIEKKLDEVRKEAKGTRDWIVFVRLA